MDRAAAEKIHALVSAIFEQANEALPDLRPPDMDEVKG